MLSDSSELHAPDTTVRKLAWTSLALSAMAAVAAGTMVMFNIGYARGAVMRVYKEEEFTLDVAGAKDAPKPLLHKEEEFTLDVVSAKDVPKNLLHKEEEFTLDVVGAKDAPKHVLHKEEEFTLDIVGAKDAPKHLLHKEEEFTLDIAGAKDAPKNLLHKEEEFTLDVAGAKAAPKHLLHKQGIISKMAADVQQAILDKHNELRKCHDAPALEWSDDIARGAQEHADACDNQELKGLCDHTPANELGDLGENLASGDGQTGAPGVVSWYSERKDTENKKGRADENTQGTGHYTQVVWKAAKQVGCGINEQQKYLICRYDAGNMGGKYSANVLAAINKDCDAALQDDGFGSGEVVVWTVEG